MARDLRGDEDGGAGLENFVMRPSLLPTATCALSHAKTSSPPISRIFKRTVSTFGGMYVRGEAIFLKRQSKLRGYRANERLVSGGRTGVAAAPYFGERRMVTWTAGAEIPQKMRWLMA